MSEFFDPARRRFLKVSAVATGALLVGFKLQGCAPSSETQDEAGRFAPNAWIRIATDGTTTLLIGRSEMGQGVKTALPMLLAEELEVGLAQVRVEFAPASRDYDNPMMFIQATGGSTSVPTAWEPLREAGATARTMLISAAASRWSVPPLECRAERGRVIHEPTGQSVGYGDLATEAAGQALPRRVRLKSPSEFKLIGQPTRRVDALDQVTGRAQFGMDVSVPGMLVATIERPPAFGARLKSFDDTAARAMAGVRDVFEVDHGVAVVAETYWQAKKARAALKVSWDLGPSANQSSEDVFRAYRELAQGSGLRARQDGHPLQALREAADVIEAVYELPYLAHATMEPMNATAHVQADRCDVWVPTQNQGGTQDVAAALTGLPLESVFVHTTHLGGGFGRRVATDFVEDAVQVSMRTKSPVKVIWSREDDTRHDYYRPAMLHRMQGAVDRQGRLSAWVHRVVGPSILAQAVPELVPAAAPNWTPRVVKRGISSVAGAIAGIVPDIAGFEGAREVPYQMDNLRVEFATHRDDFVPLGFWRSVGHSHSAFAVESFADEMAHRLGQDPLEFRRERLTEHPRHLRVLNLAAEKSGWGQPLPAGHGRGIAVHHSFGSYVAEVAEVSVSGAGQVKVHRVVIAIDCGQVVNPLTVRAQMEGGMAYGLSAVLKSQITIRNGGVEQGNFDTYQVLRMPDMPRVEVHIVDSREPPSGVGEPGTPPIAPAVCNAIFAATGKRIRRLPIDAAQLRT
ncbi:MAG: xanthine dehydrogenase family protein molybdopterin-binding subunit [Pseudomonadota bacterium]|nr:xanthine dehydrogenase family protein molybdopterin-binding subunit [Pseudomonadota bacterium]